MIGRKVERRFEGLRREDVVARRSRTILIR